VQPKQPSSSTVCSMLAGAHSCSPPTCAEGFSKLPPSVVPKLLLLLLVSSPSLSSSLLLLLLLLSLPVGPALLPRRACRWGVETHSRFTWCDSRQHTNTPSNAHSHAAKQPHQHSQHITAPHLAANSRLAVH
jgi:hypothetical protein